MLAWCWNSCATASPGGDSALLDVVNTVARSGKLVPPLHVGAAWPPTQVVEGGHVQDKDGAAVPGEISEEPGGSSLVSDRSAEPAHAAVRRDRAGPAGQARRPGGVTFSPADDAGLEKAAENPKQLYLIATTSIASVGRDAEAKKP